MSRLQQQVSELRQMLWLNHGCEINALYGDDGEMQCTKCMVDFKRDSLALIKDKWHRKSMFELRERFPLPPSPQSP